MGAFIGGWIILSAWFIVYVGGGLFYYKVIKHSKKPIGKILDEDL